MTSRSRLMVCFLVTFATLLAPQRAASGQGADEAVHLEVVVRPRAASAMEAAPGRSLKQSSFRLLQQGKRLNVQVTEGGPHAFPPHLLLLAGNLATDCLPERDGIALNRLIAKGWEVRLADSTGRVTVWLRPGVDVGAACASAGAASRDPLQSLAEMPVRRVVMLLGKPGPGMEDQAIRTIPEIYAVDGGVEVSTFTPLLVIPGEGPVSPPDSGKPYTVPCHPVGGRTSANDVCNVGVGAKSKAAGFGRGMLHERDVAGALKDLLASDDRYFDLSFPAQASHLRGLALSFPRDNAVDLVVTPYAETQSNGAEIRRRPLDIEVTLSQR